MATAGSIVIDLLLRTGSLETDSKRAEKRLQEMKKEAIATGKALGTAIAAGVGVASAVIISWTNDIVSLGAELERFSKLSDSSTQEFQKWAAGAASVGIQQEKLADQLKDFNEKLGEFQETGGGGMKDFFEQIAPKINLTADAFRNLSGPQAMQLYYDSLDKANLSQKQMSFYLESMASDTTALIPLLADGGRGFKQWGEQAERAGAILDDKTIAAVKGFREQSSKLDLVLLGMKNTIADEVLPSYERFTRLVNDQETQGSLRAIADLIGTAASAAVAFAEKIAAAGNAYRGWLGDRGFLPADQLDSMEQLQTRAEKLRRYLNKPADPATALFRWANSDKVKEELKKAEDAIKAFPFRDVTATVSTTYTDEPAPSGGGGGGGGSGKKAREMPDFKQSHEELLALMRVEEDARIAFDKMAATLSGPIAEANYQYNLDLAELNDLARVGGIATADLTRAQEQLAQQHQKNVEAIQAQLEPGKAVLDQLGFELELMKLGNTERATAIQLRGMDAESIAKYGDDIAAMNQKIEESIEQTNFMDGMRDSFQGFFEDVLNGNKSIEDSFKDMLSNISAMIANRIAENWVDQLFGQKGISGSGAAGGWLSALSGGMDSEGNNWGSIFDLLKGGDWGFADGGFTGPGGKYQAAGLVHAGEYVINAEATKKLGMGFLDSLNGYADGGLVGALTNESGPEHMAPRSGHIQSRVAQTPNFKVVACLL